MSTPSFVINVGFELGVIPRSVFCMLVMMAILTTVMTTPILLRMARGTELEPLISQTSFALKMRGLRRSAEATAHAPRP